MEIQQRKKIRLLPYGESDFASIRRANKYYVDKTMYIPLLEEYRYQMFLRPRRYGKSLLLNMLAAYYDVAMGEEFDALFGDLAIGKEPTEEHNKYLILKFDFSKVNPDYNETQRSFNRLVLETLIDFAERYKEFLPEGTAGKMAEENKSNDAFTSLLNIVRRTKHSIYAIIDEYDNFANTLLADSESNYNDITHGDGFFRLFFNNLKAATTDNDAAVSRIMICGVTPLTLSDVTSGYNIGTNISTKSRFNSLVGFTETEYRGMLEYYREATGVFNHTVDELIEITKPWYDNNCFSVDSTEDDRMYNSDMGLYFLREYIEKGGRIPEEMVDMNITTDYNKMVKLIRFENQFGERTSLIQKINNEGQIYANIKGEFALKDLGRYENLVSLMYYMGLLSVGGYDMGTTILTIPNNTIRQQYFRYMNVSYDRFISWKTDENVMTELGRNLAWKGAHEPFFRYIAECMKDATKNNDFNKYGESFVKGFFLCQFGAKLSYYTPYTEQETDHGYSDLYLEPRRDTPHGYVIELKYCKHTSKPAEVDALLSQAQTQLPNYINSKGIWQKAKDGGWRLHGIILVFRGWELARYEVMEPSGQEC